MAHELKLHKGRASLVISSGRYGLGNDFVPPSTNWALNMSGSTSANRLGGSNVISRRAVNASMSFTVYVAGSSTAEVDRGVIDIARMLDMAGDENEPLYLEWRANSDLPVPVWGQFGAPLSIEVVSGSVMRDDLYGLAGRRADKARIMVSVVVKPFWKGLQQYIAHAEGCVLEDRSPIYPDGRSRGVIVRPGVTNLMTNPVFGYSGNPLYGWSDTTSNNELNFNPEYILFGNESCKTISNDGTGRSHQSINLGNTNAYILSCYAKLPDSGVISATQCALYYGAAKSTTYTAVGNGWYRLNADVTGIASATETGIQVESGYSVYTDGFQLEAGAGTPSAFSYGDLPGCAWNGAAHSSTSTETPGGLFLPFNRASNQGWNSSYYLDQFSVAITFKASVANTWSYDMFFIDNGAIEAYFESTDDKFYFTDGTNTCSTAAQTFAAGDVIHLVFVAKPGELRIYVNGASAASAAAYDPDQGVMYFGANSTPGYQAMGTLQGFTVYDIGLSAAQVTSIYNAALPLIADKELVDWIPYSISTDISQNITNQYEDATHKDYLVIGGIPGSLPADSIVENILQGSIYKGLTLSLNAVDQPQRMLDTFEDESGTALASTLGGEVRRLTAFTTTPGQLTSGMYISLPAYNYQRKNVYAMVKLVDNGAGLQARLEIGNVDGDWQSLAADTTIRFFLIGPITMPDMIPPEFMGNWYPRIHELNVYAKRTGSSATADLDYIRYLFGKTCHVVSPGSYATIMVRGNQAYIGNSEEVYQSALFRGEAIEFEPDKYNYLIILNGTIADSIAYTATSVSYLWITPRWSLA